MHVTIGLSQVGVQTVASEPSCGFKNNTQIAFYIQKPITLNNSSGIP
jgi:hypothetical protein